jgi:hypothetical protein
MAKQNPNTATYARDPKTRGQDFPYERKFAGLIRLCETIPPGVKNVVVSWPWVLGDTHDELIESLSRLADAGLSIHIVGRFDGDKTRLAKMSRN